MQRIIKSFSGNPQHHPLSVRLLADLAEGAWYKHGFVSWDNFQQYASNNGATLTPTKGTDSPVYMRMDLEEAALLVFEDYNLLQTPDGLHFFTMEAAA